MEPAKVFSPSRVTPRRILQVTFALLFCLLLLAVVGALVARRQLRTFARAALPQLSGTLHVSGLAAPVTVTRDPQGVPSLRAASPADLFFAQGFVTAQDRLFQMDTLRRHAAGTLAEILGPSLLPHDRAQRILGLDIAADGILAQLPASQRFAFQRYADGINAAIASQASHLPLGFRILAYTPARWTSRDCVLVSLILFQELTNTFPRKLAREDFTARFDPSANPELRAQLLSDLYPVGSWRDHPPSQPATDVTNPFEAIPEIPLDPSQTRLRLPAPAPSSFLALERLLSPISPDLRAGSNGWAVNGSHTASTLPLLSNDMHLNLTAPGIWYTINLATPASRVSGVSLPGVPFIIVGHNDHVAWGFTNLGADVQDLYLEHLRKNDTEFRTPAGQWLPVLQRTEHIHVRGGRDVSLDIRLTTHSGVPTPLVTSLLSGESRPISLRWSLFDTFAASFPFDLANTATTGAQLAQEFSTFTGPTLNLVYADDGNHIGYHAIGRVPIRGSLSSPAPLSPVPTDTASSDALSHEWVGFVPYDQLPATIDPQGGVLVTANSRVTPGTGTLADYPYPITLDWVSPYRTERLYHLLTGRSGLRPADMLPIQTDIYSQSDKLIAHRLAYAIDHTPDARIRAHGGSPHQTREAADLLRDWNGELRPDTPAPLIESAARDALWTLLLTPKLGAPTSSAASGPSSLLPLYQWFEKDFAQEQIIAHEPARWLPPSFPNWDDLLTASVVTGLRTLHAPRHPAKLRYGHTSPATGAPATTDLELPLFAQSSLLRRLFGLPTGSGPLVVPGNGRTVWQSAYNFGPSERFTGDLAQPNSSTLVLPMGEAENPLSPFFRDQLPAWLHATTFPLPFVDPPAVTTLTLKP